MQAYRIRAVASSRLLLFCLVVPVIFSSIHVHAQSSNPSVIGVVFECDDNLQPIDPESAPPRKIGHEFHICIEPNRQTLHRNVRMRSIDSFGFMKEGTSISQLVIDKGLETDRTLTLILCVPGSITCSFKTTILPEFFYESISGNITGIGDVSMQMTENGYRRRQLTRTTRGQVEWREGKSPIQPNLRTESLAKSHRRGRGVEGDFAGHDEVKITIPLELINPPRTTVLGTGDIDGSLWQEAPSWVRAFIMAIGMLLLSILLCLVFFCFSILLFRTNTSESSSRRKVSEDNASFPIKILEFTEREETERDCTMIVPSNEIDERPYLEEDPNVYFDSNEQSGTVAFYKALDRTLKKYKSDNFSPEVYRHIKAQLPGRLFFYFDSKNENEYAEPGGWTELPKKELVKRVKQEFEGRKLAKYTRTKLPSMKKNYPESRVSGRGKEIV